MSRYKFCGLVTSLVLANAVGWAYGELPRDPFRSDPAASREVRVDSFVEEHMLRQRYTVRGRLNPGDKPKLADESESVWYTLPLARAWADNQAQLQTWTNDEREKFFRRDQELLDQNLVFFLYLKANPDKMGMDPKVDERIQIQLMDDKKNVFDAFEIRSGGITGMASRGVPALTVLFQLDEEKDGIKINRDSQWWSLVVLIDGSRYFFDFPVKGSQALSQ